MLEKQHAIEVIARLDSARQQNHGLVASDADGTLWIGDVGIDVFESMLYEGAIREEAWEGLDREAREFGLTPEGSPTEIADRLYAAFERGEYPEKRCYEMMAWAFAGFSFDEAKDYARKVLGEKKLKERLHGEMGHILDWARKESIPLRVVSASPLPVVQAGVELWGIAPSQVIAAASVVKDGQICLKMAASIPYGPGKVDALRREAPGMRLIGAFGDNVFDIEMLQLSEIPVAVRPKNRLLERRQEIPNLVELEVKE